MNMKLEVVQCLEYQEPKVQRMENLEPEIRFIKFASGDFKTRRNEVTIKICIRV